MIDEAMDMAMDHVMRELCEKMEPVLKESMTFISDLCTEHRFTVTEVMGLYATMMVNAIHQSFLQCDEEIKYFTVKHAGQYLSRVIEAELETLCQTHHKEAYTGDFLGRILSDMMEEYGGVTDDSLGRIATDILEDPHGLGNDSFERIITDMLEDPGDEEERGA